MPERKEFQNTISVSTTFFAFLLGVGLTHLLEVRTEELGALLGANRWLAFLAGALFFLRLLWGSANHQWKCYVRSERTPNLRDFMIDTSALVVFGVLGVVAAYQTELICFFGGIHLTGVS